MILQPLWYSNKIRIGSIIWCLTQKQHEETLFTILVMNGSSSRIRVPLWSPNSYFVPTPRGIYESPSQCVNTNETFFSSRCSAIFSLLYILMNEQFLFQIPHDFLNFCYRKKRSLILETNTRASIFSCFMNNFNL